MTDEVREKYRYQLVGAFDQTARSMILNGHHGDVGTLLDLWELVSDVWRLLAGTEEPLFEDDKPMRWDELPVAEQKWSCLPCRKVQRQ